MPFAKWWSFCLRLYVLTQWDLKQMVNILQMIFSNAFSWMGMFGNLFNSLWLSHASVNFTIIGSDNGLSPDWCQAIIWTNAGILLIGPLGTNFSEILIEFKYFHSGKYIWKCLENGGYFVSASMC